MEKVDLVPLPNDPFTRAAFERRQRMAYDAAGHTASFVTAEDIVLAKLLAFQQTGSDKHLRDARGVVLTQWDTLDLDAIRRQALPAGVLDQLEDIVQAARREWEDETP